MNNNLHEKFANFHAKNPAVWELFKRFTFEAINKGYDNFSVALVVERIRWESMVRTTDVDFKISNSYKAFYARKFHEVFPKYDGIFRTKKSVADKKILWQQHELY